MTNSPRTFTAADVAELTGVSQTQQRDWRRHGFIPANEGGWTRFSVADVCRLLLFRLFAAQKIGPAGSRDVVDRLVPQFAAMVDAAAQGEHPAEGGDRVAVIWANGELCTYPAIQTALDLATDEQQAGPCVVVDLSNLSVPLGIRVRRLIELRDPAGMSSDN